MTKQPPRPRDPNQLGKLIVNISVGEVEDHVPTPEEEGKDPAAVAMGKKGGAARAKSMTPERRAEIARKAAAKRWGNARARATCPYMHYNFARIHKTLRITPAMTAGVTDRLWSIEDVANVVEAAAPKPGRPATTRSAPPRFEPDPLPPPPLSLASPAGSRRAGAGMHRIFTIAQWPPSGGPPLVGTAAGASRLSHPWSGQGSPGHNVCAKSAF
jgi:hypothetical protein